MNKKIIASLAILAMLSLASCQNAVEEEEVMLDDQDIMLDYEMIEEEVSEEVFSEEIIVDEEVSEEVEIIIDEMMDEEVSEEDAE